MKGLVGNAVGRVLVVAGRFERFTKVIALARPALGLALLACGLHLGEAMPVSAQEHALHDSPEITRLDEPFEYGRVVMGSISFSYVGALAGSGIGFLLDRGTGCGSRNCEWDGILGVGIGALTGTVLGPVLGSHWLNEQRGNLAVNFLVTTGVTGGAWAAFRGYQPHAILALPALAGLTAGLTEMVTARGAARVETRVVPPPPDPDGYLTRGSNE